MRLFHIADLHFGKTVYGVSMLEDQRYWTERFLALCRERRPDAVLIAGDVYDRAAPSGDAVTLLDHLLTQLSQMQIPVLMVAGNHDSGQRLAFAAELLAREHVHIAGSIDLKTGSIDHMTYEDPDGYGPVTFWLLPYTYPEQIALALGQRETAADEEPETEGSPAAAVDSEEAAADHTSDDRFRTYDSALRELLAVQEINPEHRNVILSHQNVTAGGKEVQRGGSETMVGGVGRVDCSLYDGFDYVALGHIHSGYPVGRPQVRYAGTPLCYHFAETRQAEKGVVEVLLGARGEAPVIETVPIRPLHGMRWLQGTKEEIYALLQEDAGRGEYVGITLTDERITPETAMYLRQLLQTRESRLLELLSTHTAFENTGRSASVENVEERAVEDLFADFYTEQCGGMPPEDAEYGLLCYAGELVRRGDAHLPLAEADVEKLLARAEELGKENTAGEMAEPGKLDAAGKEEAECKKADAAGEPDAAAKGETQE